MSPRHHSDTSPGALMRRIKKIEKAIRESNAARRLEAATIGKGGVTVKDGGSIVGKYPPNLGGGEGLRIGPHTGEKAEAGYAIQLNDETGTIIFAATRSTPTPDFPSGASAVFATGGSLFFDDGAGTGFVVFGGGAEVDSMTDIKLASITGTKITHSTTGAAANCFIDPSDGRIWRSTSSLRYKQDVEDAEVDPAEVLQLQPKTWRDRGEVEADPDTETRYIGLLAEDLHQLPTMRQFVVYDADGNPDAIAEPRLAVALLAVVKDLNARLTALEEG